MQAIWHVSTTHAHTPWIMDIWADLTFQYWTYRIVSCNISSHFNCKVWLADKCKLRLAGKDRYVLCLLLRWWQVFQLVWYNETVHVWGLRLYSLCYTPCIYTPCGDCNKIWSPWHKRQDGRIVTRKCLIPRGGQWYKPQTLTDNLTPPNLGHNLYDLKWELCCFKRNWLEGGKSSVLLISSVKW